MPPFKANKLRLCGCGCGEPTPLKYVDGRFKGYAKGIPGHRRKHANERLREFRLKQLADAREARTLPIGSRRLHEVSSGKFYYVVKANMQGRWRYEHRIVAERMLGRALYQNEHIHHINENPLDNRPENLQVVTPLQHRRKHGLNGRWSLKYLQCRRCNSTERKHLAFGLCTRCYQQT